jgi:hypothetical protein
VKAETIMAGSRTELSPRAKARSAQAEKGMRQSRLTHSMHCHQIGFWKSSGSAVRAQRK